MPRTITSALEQEITTRTPDRIILPPEPGLWWLEAIRHAPCTLVECLAQLELRPARGNKQVEEVHRSLVVRYAVPGMRQVAVHPNSQETRATFGFVPFEGAPLAQIPLAGLGGNDGDLGPAAEQIIALAREAPATVPRHLRLGLAGLRYHVGQNISAEARRAIVALARQEAADPDTAPSAADQARRLGLSPQLFSKWKSTVTPAADEESDRK